MVSQPIEFNYLEMTKNYSHYIFHTEYSLNCLSLCIQLNFLFLVAVFFLGLHR